MTRFIVLTQRPIEGLLEVANHLWHTPELLFKVNARIVKIDGDKGDLRVIRMFIYLASMFGMYAYLYDPYKVTNKGELDKLDIDYYHVDDVIYYLGGTCHANIEQLASDNNYVITYGRVLNMKNGFSQIIEYGEYKYIRYYSADGRSTSTIMDVECYLTSNHLKDTFATMFGTDPSVVNFTVVPNIPRPSN